MPIPPWLNRFFGNKPDSARPLPVRPGTVVLKPLNQNGQVLKPQGREITLQPNGELARPAAPRQPFRSSGVPQAKQLTPAAMIYALAAGILFTLAVYNIFHGSIFNGIVTLLPAGGLAVLSYKYIQ